MSEITLFSFPQDINQTPAQLAVQLWLKTMESGATINTWDKDKRANAATPTRASVPVSDIQLDKLVVEYPTVFDTEEGTFTTTIILPEKEELFIVDAHVPYLTPLDFMANNQGVSVQDQERVPGELGLEDVITLATETPEVPYYDYTFVQAIGSDEWLLLLTNQHTLYTPAGLLRDLFGPYLPRSATATLKDIGESRFTQPPEILSDTYVGSITLSEPVVPTLTTINIINLPLLADVYRDRPLNHDGTVTYDGTEYYTGEKSLTR